jgi:hypothetical protein
MNQVTPFQLIERGVDQTRPGALAQVPSYGISNPSAWSGMQRTASGYLVKPGQSGAALSRMACRSNGVWTLIESLPAGPDLLLSNEVGQRIEQEHPDCVSLDSAGSVVNVSLPWAAQDQKGPVALALILVPLVAYFVARFLLSRFKKSVKRSLANDVGGDPPPWTAAPAIHPSPLRLRELLVEAPSKFGAKARAFRRGKVAVSFAIAGASAFTLAHAWVAHSDAAQSLNRTLGVSVVLAWPLVPTVASLLVNRRPFIRALLIYMVVAAVAALWFGPSLLILLAISLGSALGSWTLFIPRTRAALPWVLLPATFGVLGLFAVTAALQRESNQRLLAEVADGVGLSAISAVGVTVLASILFSVIASLVFARGVVRFVRRFRLSSNLLCFVYFWLLNVLSISQLIGARDNAVLQQAQLGLLPVLLAIAVAIVWTAGKPATGPRVLYLRSFDGGVQNATLLARIETWLSGIANVDLIAGPDVASALAEPVELLDFIAGKGARKYVTDLAAFEATRANLPDQVYADGSHPIRHYFCRNAVWFDAFRILARDCDAVVMDVRGLKGDPMRGVARELVEVVHRVPVRHIVLLVSNEPRSGLQALLTLAWSSLPVDSPNRDEQNPELCIVNASRADAIDVLAGHICQVLDAKLTESATTAPGATARAL